MKINLDLTKHQSMGNVYQDKPSDNYQQFESAKKVYADNKDSILASIADILTQGAREILAGTTITIPAGHYKNSDFINNLSFIVDQISTDNIDLSLTNVGYKTSH
jgi:hypothetical protein